MFEKEAEEALNELLTEFGSYWVWNDKTILGMQSDQSDSNAIELTGMLPDVSFTICFRKSDFDTNKLPKSGDRIFNSNDESDFFRIESVQTSIGDPSVTVSCGSIDGK